MDLGIGRGDSRAPRARQAADHDGHARGGDRRHPRPRRGPSRSTYEGTELQLPWTGRWKLPVWVAGYGPMALAMTGRVADGVILQLADPDLIGWFVGPGAGRRGGRRPAAPAGQGPGRGAGPRRRPAELCRERTRWFPALVSNHVVDLVNKYPREQLPDSLTGYIRDRDRLRLPPPRRGRLDATPPSWATR